MASYISRWGGNEEDIRARIGKPLLRTTSCEGSERTISFTKKQGPEQFKSNALFLLLYGWKTRWMIQADVEKLNVLLYMSLHRILKIYWPMCITNEEIEIRAEIQAISKHMARRRWAWPGQALRIDHHFHVRITLTWLPENNRTRVYSEG